MGSTSYVLNLIISYKNYPLLLH